MCARRECAFERIEDKSLGIVAVTDAEEGHYRDTFQFREIIKTIFRASIGRATFFSPDSSSFVLRRERCIFLRYRSVDTTQPAYASKRPATCAKRRITKGMRKVPSATERQFLSDTVEYPPTDYRRAGRDDPISVKILLPNRRRRRDGYSKASHIGIQNFTVR